MICPTGPNPKRLTSTQVGRNCMSPTSSNCQLEPSCGNPTTQPKPNLPNSKRLGQQTFQQTPHSHYNRHKTNTCHIHTSIVSRHLATRGNNKILRTPPPHTLAALKRYFTASLVTPLPNPEQINHPSLNHIYTKSTPKHNPSALCLLGNTHIHNTHHLFNFTHIRTTLSPLDMCTYPLE